MRPQTTQCNPPNLPWDLNGLRGEDGTPWEDMGSHDCFQRSPVDPYSSVGFHGEFVEAHWIV